MERKYGVLSNYEPTYLDKMRYWMQDALTPYMGGDAKRAGAFVQDKVMPTAEFLPGIGDAMGIAEAADEFNQGNYGTAGALGSLAAIGMIPGVGDVAQKAGKRVLKTAPFHKSVIKKRGDKILELLKSGKADEITNEMLDIGNDADYANLAAYLWDNYDIPLDEVSRMARQKQFAADFTDFYHGTGEDLKAFDPSKYGSATSANSARRAAWMADKPTVAEGYADNASFKKWLKEQDPRARFPNVPDERGQNIMPLSSAGTDYQIDAKGAAYGSPEFRSLSALLNNAQDAGHQGVFIDNFKDNMSYRSAQETAGHLGVFDPADIRSRFARFDPRLKHLSNLSAGIAPFGALGILNAYQDENYQPPVL